MVNTIYARFVIESWVAYIGQAGKRGDQKSNQKSNDGSRGVGNERKDYVLKWRKWIFV